MAVDQALQGQIDNIRGLIEGVNSFSAGTQANNFNTYVRTLEVKAVLDDPARLAIGSLRRAVEDLLALVARPAEVVLNREERVTLAREEGMKAVRHLERTLENVELSFRGKTTG